MVMDVLADIGRGLFQALDYQIVLLGIVPQRRVNGLLGQKRAVHLHRRQPVQSLHDRLVGHFQSLLHGLAAHEFGSHRTRGNGRTAAERLEFCIANDLVLVDIQVNAHDIAAYRIAHGAAAARILDLSHIARVREMIHYLIGVIHCHSQFLASIDLLNIIHRTGTRDTGPLLTGRRTSALPSSTVAAHGQTPPVNSRGKSRRPSYRQ